MRELGHGPQQYISNVIGSGSVEVVKSSLLIDGRSMKKALGTASSPQYTLDKNTTLKIELLQLKPSEYLSIAIEYNSS